MCLSLSLAAYEEIKSAEDAKLKDLEDRHQKRLRMLEEKIEKEKTNVKYLKEEMAAIQEAHREIIDLLKEPTKLLQILK